MEIKLLYYILACFAYNGNSTNRCRANFIFTVLMGMAFLLGNSNFIFILY